MNWTLASYRKPLNQFIIRVSDLDKYLGFARSLANLYARPDLGLFYDDMYFEANYVIARTLYRYRNREVKAALVYLAIEHGLYDLIRAAGANKRSGFTDGLKAAVTVRADPEDPCIISDHEFHMKRLVGKQRRAVGLSVEGYKNREIAEILGVAERGIEKILRQARVIYHCSMTDGCEGFVPQREKREYFRA